MGDSVDLRTSTIGICEPPTTLAEPPVDGKLPAKRKKCVCVGVPKGCFRSMYASLKKIEHRILPVPSGRGAPELKTS